MVNKLSLDELLSSRDIRTIDSDKEKKLLDRIRQAAQSERRVEIVAVANELLGNLYEAGVWYRKAGREIEALNAFITEGKNGFSRGTGAAMKMYIHRKQYQDAKDIYLAQQAGNIELLALIVKTKISFSSEEYRRIAEEYLVNQETEYTPGQKGLFLLDSCLIEGNGLTGLQLLKNSPISLAAVYSSQVSFHLFERYSQQDLLSIFTKDEVAAAYSALVINRYSFEIYNMFKDESTHFSCYRIRKAVAPFLRDHMQLPLVAQALLDTYTEQRECEHIEKGALFREIQTKIADYFNSLPLFAPSSSSS